MTSVSMGYTYYSVKMW